MFQERDRRARWPTSAFMPWRAFLPRGLLLPADSRRATWRFRFRSSTGGQHVAAPWCPIEAIKYLDRCTRRAELLFVDAFAHVVDQRTLPYLVLLAHNKECRRFWSSGTIFWNKHSSRQGTAHVKLPLSITHQPRHSVRVPLSFQQLVRPAGAMAFLGSRPDFDPLTATSLYDGARVAFSHGHYFSTMTSC